MIKVLLADDSPHAQRMGLDILSREGFEVRSVTDASEVGRNLEQFTPDLLLADAHLPGESGYRICERIKADPARGHIKVVLLVGALEPFDAGEAERVKADAVLHKPFEASVVLKTLRALSGQQPLEQKPAPPPPRESILARPRAAQEARTSAPAAGVAATSRPEGSPVPAAQDLPAAGHAPLDRERVRAAVVLAVESALPVLVDDLTERVLAALGHDERRGAS